MKSRVLPAALFAGLFLSSPVFAACNVPDDPAIPDGSAASGADMLKAKKAVEGYVSAIENYLDCGIPLSQQERASRKMAKVVEKFNEELRNYKVKS